MERRRVHRAARTVRRHWLLAAGASLLLWAAWPTAAGAQELVPLATVAVADTTERTKPPKYPPPEEEAPAPETPPDDEGEVPTEPPPAEPTEPSSPPASDPELEEPTSPAPSPAPTQLPSSGPAAQPTASPPAVPDAPGTTVDWTDFLFPGDGSDTVEGSERSGSPLRGREGTPGSGGPGQWLLNNALRRELPLLSQFGIRSAVATLARLALSGEAAAPSAGAATGEASGQSGGSASGDALGQAVVAKRARKLDVADGTNNAPEALLFFLAAILPLLGGGIMATRRHSGGTAATRVVPAANGSSDRPVLFLDVDGVIALNRLSDGTPPGRPHLLEPGLVYVSDRSARLVQELASRFELIWASGWEHRANAGLPGLLGLDGPLPALSFGRRARFGSSEWKIKPVDRYARGRPAVWIDDNLDERHERWAERRGAPTLLVKPSSDAGISGEHVQQVLQWADELGMGRNGLEATSNGA